MKRFALVMVCVFAFSVVFAQTNDNEEPATGESIAVEDYKNIILPFEIISAEEETPTEDTIRALVFRSFYNFIGIIPGANLVEPDRIEELGSVDEIKANAENSNIRRLVRGSIQLIARNRVRINIYLWDQFLGEEYFSKSYTSPTDLDLLDNIDVMIGDLTTEMFQRAVSIAYLEFRDFSIGAERYNLYVNNVLIDRITNENFNLNLRVLADETYNVVLRRQQDMSIVFENAYPLKENQRERISHKAEGTVNIRRIRHKKARHKYEMFFNDEVATENQTFTLPAGRSYEIKVLEDGELVYIQTNYLADKVVLNLEPELERITGLNFTLTFLDGNMLNLNFDYYFTSKMAAGIAIGGAYIPAALLKLDPTVDIPDFAFLNIDLGYTYLFLNDRTHIFRAGAKANFRYQLSFLEPEFQSFLESEGVFPNSFMAGLHVFVQFSIFHLQFGMYYDINNAMFSNPNIIAGFRF